MEVPVKVFADIRPKRLAEVPDAVRRMEAMGFDGVSFAEFTVPPTLSSLLAAEHSSNLKIMTGVFIAFPRSPMATAYDAWNLHDISKGRFILGLGPQTKGHLTRRWGMEFLPPAPRMRDYILALRAIFACMQEGTPLSYDGRYYRFDRMTPAFNPGSNPYGLVPIYIAGINEHMCRVAGEVCDGHIAADPVTEKFTHEVILPNLEEGARRGDRSVKELDISGGGFIGCGATQEDLQVVREKVRARIAFYASTPTYSSVLDLHGWGEIVPILHDMSLRGEWEKMPSLITDVMLEHYAVIGTPQELPQLLKRRYDGYATRLHLYQDWFVGVTDQQLADLVRGIKAISRGKGHPS